MKNAGDGFFVNSYTYYIKPEAVTRYQVIYSARDVGHKHIENAVAGNLTSEAAALGWIEALKQDPDWKRKLERNLISSQLNGLTVRYQLMNFDQLFADWSEHEKSLALEILTERAEKLNEQKPQQPSLGELIANARTKQQGFEGQAERPSCRPER